jgi:hypothetical protein
MTLQGEKRIAEALERIAAADEHRNELLVADAAERRASWAESEARQERALEALTHGQGTDRLEVLEAALRRLDAIARVEPRNATGDVEFTEALRQSFIALHPNERPA